MKWNGNESVNLVVIKENNRTPPFFPLFRLCCFVSLLSLFLHTVGDQASNSLNSGHPP